MQLADDGIPPVRARNKVSQMFLVSAATVKRWSASWKATREDALLDHRSAQDERDTFLLIASPALVFELKKTGLKKCSNKEANINNSTIAELHQ